MVLKVQKKEEMKEKLQLQRRRLRRRRPRRRWKKCNPVRKKKTQLETELLIDKPMILNSLICKLINVQASMKENNEKKMESSWALTYRPNKIRKLLKKKERLLRRELL